MPGIMDRNQNGYVQLAFPCLFRVVRDTEILTGAGYLGSSGNAHEWENGLVHMLAYAAF